MLPRCQARSLRERAVEKPHECRDRVDPELPHHAASVDLDGIQGDLQLGRDLFVEKPARNQLGHLTLARGEPCEALCGRGLLTVTPPRLVRRASARDTASSSSPSCTGLTKKSTAPSRMALAVDGTSAWPLRNTIGMKTPASASRC